MGIPKTLTARAVTSAAACLAALMTNVAAAGNITLGFDGMSTGSFTTNFVDHGIKFSASCHYDVVNRVDGGATTVSNWLGFDASGCYDGSATGYNHDYQGPAGVGVDGRLYVGLDGGALMSLKSLKFVSIVPDSGGFSLYSSNGGMMSIDYNGGILAQHDFTGPQWTDVSWLVFSYAGGEPAGFDDLQLDVHKVDEPATLALMGLSVLGLAVRRGRRSKEST